MNEEAKVLLLIIGYILRLHFKLREPHPQRCRLYWVWRRFSNLHNGNGNYRLIFIRKGALPFRIDYYYLQVQTCHVGLLVEIINSIYYFATSLGILNHCNLSHLVEMCLSVKGKAPTSKIKKQTILLSFLEHSIFNDSTGNSNTNDKYN